MDKKIVSREYSSVTKCDLMDDGYWKAYTETKDAALYEGETEWVIEAVDAMSMDTDPSEAIKVAMNSVLQYIVTNVYQNGFKSLVEYREFERMAIAKKAEATSDLKTQGI
jgi:hypothetical protein